MRGFGWWLRSRVKAFGPGWNAEILAELVSLRVEVPGAGGGRGQQLGQGSGLGYPEPRPGLQAGFITQWPPTLHGPLGCRLFPSALRVTLLSQHLG